MSEVRTGVGLTPLSPAELLRALLLNEVDPGVVPNIVIGPATADQQAAGVAQIVDVGKAKVERYVPLIWPKHQIRCLAPTLSQADQIGRASCRERV